MDKTNLEWSFPSSGVAQLTDDAHDDRGLPGGDLLHEGEDLVDDEPLVEVRQELPQADEAVDAHREQRRRDAQLLDPRQQRVLHRLVVEEACMICDERSY